MSKVKSMITLALFALGITAFTSVAQAGDGYLTLKLRYPTTVPYTGTNYDVRCFGPLVKHVSDDHSVTQQLVCTACISEKDPGTQQYTWRFLEYDPNVLTNFWVQTKGKHIIEVRGQGKYANAKPATAEIFIGDPIETTNAFGTEYNPFALPTTMPHWISDLCWHKKWTNSYGPTYRIPMGMLKSHDGGSKGGIKEKQKQGNWFLGTNVYNTTTVAKSENSVDNVLRDVFTHGDRGFVKNTLLMKMNEEAKAKMPAGFSDEKVGLILQRAVCEIGMPHEASEAVDPFGSITFTQCNETFMSNVVKSVGGFAKTTMTSSWQSGQRFDGGSWGTLLCPGYICKFTGKDFTTTWKTVNMTWDRFDEHYGKGLRNAIALMDEIPDDWEGEYRLAAKDDEQAIAAGMDWPVFDEDVYLDRGDVQMMKFACHALNAVSKMLRAYYLTGDNDAERKQLEDLQTELFAIPCERNYGQWGYASRIEHTIYNFFRMTPTMLSKITDTEARDDASAAFKEAVRCYLNADAYIFGRWPSPTGDNFGGARDNKLHLIELFEDEAGAEWNAAGWRMIAVNAWNSMDTKGAAPINLVKLGEQLHIKSGDTLIDFGGLGEKRDGEVALSFYDFFQGKLIHGVVTDAAIGIVTNGFTTTSYGCTRSGQTIVKTNWTERLSMTVGSKTVDENLGGIYAGDTLFLDLAKMAARYPANSENRFLRGFASRFARIETCDREDVSGTKVLEEGFVYTAEPATKNGGVFSVPNGGELTGTNVTFAANETKEDGGAIFNKGTVSLKDATFTGNKARYGGGLYNGGVMTLDNILFSDNLSKDRGEDGAICNSGILNFDGPITLVTANDTVYNSGTLNWNLTNGKVGCLNGYQYLTNDKDFDSVDYGVLKLTIDDALVAPTNIVIATGDFSNIAEPLREKDTFTITNVTSGATSTIKIGRNVIFLEGTWWRLMVEQNELVLSALETVKLSDVEIVDKTTEPWTTNATAVVRALDDFIAEPDENGNYLLPKGHPISVKYTIQDDTQFPAGLKEKTVFIDALTGDISMEETGYKPVVEPAWSDTRIVAFDTRERIVVATPNDILPIAYSTNGWGEVTANQVSVSCRRDGEISPTTLVETNENGYVEWLPTYEEYGKYFFGQAWLNGGMPVDVTNATIYYSAPYAVEKVFDGTGNGTFDLSAYTFEEGTVLGYDLVDVVAKPAEDSVLSGWTLLTNGVEVVGAFEDSRALTNRFEMPCADTKILATFTLKTGCTVNDTDIAVGKGKGWEYTPAANGKMGTLELNSDEVYKIVLSGKLPSHTTVTAKPSEEPMLQIFNLNNFTNDVSDCDGAVALTVPAFRFGDGPVGIEGTNYLAAGAHASAIQVVGQTVTFSGTGSLTALPGTAETVLPAISCIEGGTCKIIKGTYNDAVDPALVDDRQPRSDIDIPHNGAFSNGDGTWTVKQYWQVTFDPVPVPPPMANAEYWMDVNDITQRVVKGECAIPPAPAKSTNQLFSHWVNKEDQQTYDFSKEVKKDLILEAAYTDSEAAQATRLYDPVVMKNYAAGDLSNAVDRVDESGVIMINQAGQVCNDIEKPVVISYGEGNEPTVTAVEDLTVTNLYDSSMGYGVVAIGEMTKGADTSLVVVKGATLPEVTSTIEPGQGTPELIAKATNFVKTVTAENLLALPTEAAYSNAVDVAEGDGDAVWTVARLRVEATGLEPGAKDTLACVEMDITPVLEVYAMPDVETPVDTLKLSGSQLSGAPVTVTFSVAALGQVPKLIVHEPSEGDVEYFYHPDDAKPGEKAFGYDAVAKTISFEMTEFSPVTVYFADDQFAVTLDAGAEGYFGAPGFTTRKVYESKIGTGKYRNLVDPTSASGETCGGWWYRGTSFVENGEPFAVQRTHTLVAEWGSPVPVARIDDTLFRSLDKAFKVAKEGDIVELLADYGTRRPIGDKAITIVENGFVATNLMLSAGTTLTIKDNKTPANALRAKRPTMFASLASGATVITDRKYVYDATFDAFIAPIERGYWVARTHKSYALRDGYRRAADPTRSLSKMKDATVYVLPAPGADDDPTSQKTWANQAELYDKLTRGKITIDDVKAMAVAKGVTDKDGVVPYDTPSMAFSMTAWGPDKVPVGLGAEYHFYFVVFSPDNKYIYFTSAVAGVEPSETPEFAGYVTYAFWNQKDPTKSVTTPIDASATVQPVGTVPHTPSWYPIAKPAAVDVLKAEGFSDAIAKRLSSPTSRYDAFRTWAASQGVSLKDLADKENVILAAAYGLPEIPKRDEVTLTAVSLDRTSLSGAAPTLSVTIRVQGAFTVGRTPNEELLAAAIGVTGATDVKGPYSAGAVTAKVIGVKPSQDEVTIRVTPKKNPPPSQFFYAPTNY